MLALWLEYQFSKEQLLTIYLNRVYLGAGTYGVDAAARKYFGISVGKISTYQSVGPYKAAMRTRLATLLAVPADCVNVKAKTAEKMGPVGEGLSIEAQAVALLVAA